jgi:hypothetical protein
VRLHVEEVDRPPSDTAADLADELQRGAETGHGLALTMARRAAARMRGSLGTSPRAGEGGAWIELDRSSGTPPS